ncbi:MAG TPA: hypothetical protein VKB28_22745 [Solirubrobacteraceae bacterium]|nr:hypothetical protein [Solirubrobacteraceae bacterium]
MSLLAVAAIVIGYLVLVAVILALMTAAKRADQQARRENRRFVRAARSGAKPTLVPHDERPRERGRHRRAG